MLAEKLSRMFRCRKRAIKRVICQTVRCQSWIGHVDGDFKPVRNGSSFRETNLKPRQPLPETQTIKDNKRELAGIQAEIVCEPPNNILSRFEGKLTMAGKVTCFASDYHRAEWFIDFTGESYALRNSHVLLRGCVLRNTAWCYGVVLFAGKDTKLMQNSGKTKFKRTKIDKLLNHVILGVSLRVQTSSAACYVILPQELRLL